MKIAQVLAVIAIVIVAAHGDADGKKLRGEDSDGYVPVPGGIMIHKSCVMTVPEGYDIVMMDDGKPMLQHSENGETIIPKCSYPAKPASQLQIYAMDTHWTAPSSGLVQKMNASWNAPELPTNDQGQVVYFWPGFKSTEPTMGFPVLQPVLQYGTDSEGGGEYWCVRSWFVCGQWGMALVSAEVAVKPQNIIASSMTYDSNARVWSIFANNTATSKTTTLKVSRAQIRSTDFHVAMLVLETIMDEGDCSQYPSSSPKGEVLFTAVSVNGAVPAWTPRVTMTDCNQAVKVIGSGDQVSMTWTSS